MGNISVNTGLLSSNIMGKSIVRWSNLTRPTYTGTNGDFETYPSGVLGLSTECVLDSFQIVGGRAVFDLDPRAAATVTSGCPDAYNKRIEVMRRPWPANNPVGTEEWYGWDVKFDDGYIIDSLNTWLFFQIHNGNVARSPALSITVGKTGRLNGSDPGVLFIENNANSDNNGIFDYANTGVIPVAGQKLNIVFHVVWGLAEDGGLVECWIDGRKVCESLNVDTVYDTPTERHGGNAKWGIYKWGWATEPGILASESLGITNLKLSIGDIRMVGRQSDDPDYLTSAYFDVYPGENVPQINCGAGSFPSTTEGERMHCWNQINLPTGYDSAGEFFDSDNLFLNSHSNVDMITKVGDRLYFKVNPTTPPAQPWGGNYNYRAEIRDTPSDANHAMGTEQWWGFNYRFESDYIIDTFNRWLFWQVHSASGSPPLALQIRPAESGEPDGMLWVVNNAINDDSTGLSSVKTPLGIVPIANTELNIVIRLINGTDETGLLQIWINGEEVYNKSEATVYPSQPNGGYAKFGIYKWVWDETTAVNNSASIGITELNTSMGDLRAITRTSSHPDYLVNSYDAVNPENIINNNNNGRQAMVNVII